MLKNVFLFYLKISDHSQDIQIFMIFQEKLLSCYFLLSKFLTKQISLSDCLYFLKYEAVSELQLFASHIAAL